MSITTRIGDKGTTSLFSGEMVPKYSLRTEAYGDIDELNSALGVARALCQREGVLERIHEIQKELFVVGAELATTKECLMLLGERVDASFLARMDQRRDALEAMITMPRGFIIPGGTLAAAHIDLARTIARRCERKAVRLRDEGLIDNEALLVWLNRLSDYLWLLGRFEEGDRVILKNA